MNRIKVSDRLPNTTKEHLVFDGDQFWVAIYRNRWYDTTDMVELTCITHWMEIIAPNG